MEKIKKDDVVARISYGKDILFRVQKVIGFKKSKKIAILKGITERIEVDSYLEDLCLIEKDEVEQRIKEEENKLEQRFRETENKLELKVNPLNKRLITKTTYGRILHLDGDKKYSEKSLKYYQKMGLRAIVKNVSESRQKRVVYSLLNYYKPDILVVTGHDGMIKKESNYNDIFNYRNSRFFVETVREARRYDDEKHENLVIFAGACQSYFEALIMAGANFASSPARILIDILDPLIVAKEVAVTDFMRYIKVDDFESKLRDGKKGIGGIGAMR